MKNKESASIVKTLANTISKNINWSGPQACMIKYVQHITDKDTQTINSKRL